MLTDSIGDVGETADDVDSYLEDIFEKAHRWRAVLLLDEADIFLQERDLGDLRRNSIVSGTLHVPSNNKNTSSLIGLTVFLRVLEYYPGILFLTTNRVGIFDEAFKSRIHLPLYFGRLTLKSTLDIWQVNLDRVTKRNKIDVDQKQVLKFAKRHFKRLEKEGQQTWNGRQIRNAFQTAIALAEYDVQDASSPSASKEQTEGVAVRATLSTKHFKTVVNASDEFEDYMKRANHNLDDDHRAQTRRTRADGSHTPARLAGSKKCSFEEKVISSSDSDSDDESESEADKKHKSKKRGKSSKGKGKSEKGKKRRKKREPSEDEDQESSSDSSDETSGAERKEKSKR